MREILFRAKAINRDKGYHRTNYKNGDWVYGLLTRMYDERFETLPAEMANEGGVNGIEIDHNTIGQYTGLTAKNRKIFEGDIVKFGDIIGIINYNFGCFCVKTNKPDWKSRTNPAIDIVFNEYPNEVEIIGNIHDNPELLKGGADNG